MKKLILVVFVSLSVLGYSQEVSFNEKEISVSNYIDGTLLQPSDTNKNVLAIIIAGSGPTDRNGNQNFLKNNSLKKLAESLTNNGISTFRYDKRIVKQIRQGNVDNNMMFDDFVSDAKDVLNHFKSNFQFSKIYVIGHSQGSLVGMLAAKDLADGFISLAGAGQNIGDVIVEQVTNMAPQLGEEAQKIVDKLKKGETTTDYPQALASVFNSDVQPFMINWMKYNPSDIIKELSIPVLIVCGTKDLQVSVDEAQLLKESNDKATLEVIENMNHVLFEIEGGDLENSKSYNEAFRPISEHLITALTDFIKA